MKSRFFPWSIFHIETTLLLKNVKFVSPYFDYNVIIGGKTVQGYVRWKFTFFQWMHDERWGVIFIHAIRIIVVIKLFFIFHGGTFGLFSFLVFGLVMDNKTSRRSLSRSILYSFRRRTQMCLHVANPAFYLRSKPSVCCFDVIFQGQNSSVPMLSVHWFPRIKFIIDIGRHSDVVFICNTDDRQWLGYSAFRLRKIRQAAAPLYSWLHL